MPEVAELMSERLDRPPDALRFLLDAYRGVHSAPGKGLPHAYVVSEILRDAGADTVTQLVGLLHDVVEDTPRTVGDVRVAFGERVADMVDALTEDDGITDSAERMRLLRGAIAGAGTSVVDVALADKIATLQYVALTGLPVTALKLTHYRATLQIGLTAGATDELCVRLRALLIRRR